MVALRYDPGSAELSAPHQNPLASPLPRPNRGSPPCVPITFHQRKNPSSRINFSQYHITSINCTTYGRRLRSSQHRTKKKRKNGRHSHADLAEQVSAKNLFTFLIDVRSPESSKRMQEIKRDPVVVFSISLGSIFTSHTFLPAIFSTFSRSAFSEYRQEDGTVGIHVNLFGSHRVSISK